MKPCVLFLDTVHPVLQDMLEEMGYVCEFELFAEPEQLKAIISKYTGIVVRGRIRLDSTLLKHAASLKFIARSGSGMENIDIEAAREKGILLINSPEGNSDAVAEHALGMLLMLFNRLHIADREVRSCKWDREGNRGREIKGKTFGIIGYGHTGPAFAKRLKGFDVRILAYDKYRLNYGDAGVEECGLNDIFEHADIVTFHVPLTPETKHYFNEQFLDCFQKPIWFINTSRGAVASLATIVKGLQDGRIRGACLDVLEIESHAYNAQFDAASPPLQYLIHSDKVVLSPHVAGWTIESYYKLSEVLGQKLQAARLQGS